MKRQAGNGEISCITTILTIVGSRYFGEICQIKATIEKYSITFKIWSTRSCYCVENVPGARFIAHNGNWK